MGIQTFFNSDGTELTAVITIIGSDGNHVDPDSWPITNDPAIVLSSHPSASKTVTAIDTGVFKVVWTGLSAALSHGDVVHISIDGAIGGTAWSTWVTPIQVVFLPTVYGQAVVTGSLGAQAKLDVNAEVDAAITDAALPAATADAVWDEAYADHTNAGTFGKLMDIIRKANLSVDGTVAGTPTVNTFDTNLTDPTSTHKHQLLVFTSGALEGVSRPILTYSQTNGQIVLQEDLPSAPSASDEFTILIQHVHPVSEIQEGLATSDNITDAQTVIIDTINSSGGDATLEKQTEILEAIEGITSAQLAALQITTGVISAFPEELVIGDSYSASLNTQIRINITDDAGDPLTGLGDLLFADADISFVAFRPNNDALIEGTCEFVDDGETYVLLSISAVETAKGQKEYTYEGRLQFYWSISSGEDDDERKTYKTTPFKFVANPI